MASPLGHSIAGIAVVLSMVPVAEHGLGGLRRWGRKYFLLLVGAVFVANIPDFDYFPGLFTGDLNRFHRGFTHSFAFCGGVTALCVLLSRLTVAGRRIAVRRLIFALVLLTFGHVVIDWLAQDLADPCGVPLFWPVSSTPFQFPFPVFPMVNKEEVWHLQNVLAAGVETFVMGAVCLVVAHARGWRLKPNLENSHDSTLARDYCR